MCVCVHVHSLDTENKKNPYVLKMNQLVRHLIFMISHVVITLVQFSPNVDTATLCALYPWIHKGITSGSKVQVDSSSNLSNLKTVLATVTIIIIQLC